MGPGIARITTDDLAVERFMNHGAALGSGLP